jgi:hypothetical protein
MRDDLLVVGRARATRYAAYRTIPDVGRQIPVFEIDEGGNARRLALLHAVLPEGFYVEALSSGVVSRFHKDLPYFLNDLRPAGFLGRLIPRRHPELGLPNDIQAWSANHCLVYATRYGWNLSGNLIVGDEAFRLYLANRRSPTDLVKKRSRARRFPALADDVLSSGAPGSSAAGEQPKFLVTRVPGHAPVLVKFSPPVRDRVSRRIADLLIAEHVAHRTLRAHRRAACTSEIVRGGGRVFLEVERFDRTARRGRRGLLSLTTLDAEFVGRVIGWSDTANELERLGIIDRVMATEIRWLELFGRLIANADMHFGNLSFYTRGTRISGVAPSYDMAPSLYAPQQAQLGDARFEPPLPGPDDAEIWTGAHRAALDFWRKVASHRLVSNEFKRLARVNRSRLVELRDFGGLLPK